MKLCHFPNILKGFWEIDSDQPHPKQPKGNPIPTAEVPEAWLEKFKLLEAALIKLGDRTPEQLGVRAEDLVDISVAIEPAWISVCLPGNMDDELILAALGYSQSEIQEMRSVYCEFFDGENDELESLRRK